MRKHFLEFLYKIFAGKGYVKIKAAIAQIKRLFLPKVKNENYYMDTSADLLPFETPALPNDLYRYFLDSKGGDILKFHHYFDIYDRYFARYRNKRVNVLEIGVFKGGSLKMWQEYFGKSSHIFGLDIDPECKKFETVPYISKGRVEDNTNKTGNLNKRAQREQSEIKRGKTEESCLRFCRTLNSKISAANAASEIFEGRVEDNTNKGENGISIIIGDQSDGNFMLKLMNELPTIDILIDDGGHSTKQQITTFISCYDKLADDGIYLCEDLQTNLTLYYRDSRNTFIDLAKKHIEYMFADNFIDKNNKVPLFTSITKSISFYNQIIVFEKEKIMTPIIEMR